MLQRFMSRELVFSCSSEVLVGMSSWEFSAQNFSGCGPQFGAICKEPGLHIISSVGYTSASS